MRPKKQRKAMCKNVRLRTSVKGGYGGENNGEGGWHGMGMGNMVAGHGGLMSMGMGISAWGADG